MKMKRNYQAPAFRVITLLSRPLLSGSSPTATFMGNPGISDGNEEAGDQ